MRSVMETQRKRQLSRNLLAAALNVLFFLAGAWLTLWGAK